LSDKLKTVLLFGQPGVGKGTQGKILGSVRGFVHLATGDMFRGLDRESALGKEFLKYSTQGLLVPDELTCLFWQQYVQGLIDTNQYKPDSDLLLLDGIPRSVEQIKILEEHIEVLRVIHLICDDQEALVKRMKKRADQQGRPDDADEDVIRRRFKVYYEETRPVLEYFDQSRVSEIHAIGLPGQILQKILNEIMPEAKDAIRNPFG